ncbi:MAG: glucosamine-6-phosphate deaminase [Rubripirellula sp.]|jgi:glucosamine-6-phosphate deaminase|nr:glucosamine-6-phosphate deaminase [Rubripirellula sp.]
MRTILTADAKAMGQWVGEHTAEDLRQAIAKHGEANIVVATGASQFEVLQALVQQGGIDWSKVHGFHLDEYVGISTDHGASFCRYLKERFVDHLNLASFHYLRGDADPTETIGEIGGRLSQTRIDLALVGIGENGHLAFNDPPADFETEKPYLLVELDEPCRMQQVGEGWFDSLADVPTHAISMSVRQILKSAKIYCSVPDARKAAAVRGTLEDSVSPEIPASILREHQDAILVIDQAAASQLGDETRASLEQV